MTGINRNRSPEPLAGSWFQDFTGKILRSGRFLPYGFDLGYEKFLVCTCLTERISSYWIQKGLICSFWCRVNFNLKFDVFKILILFICKSIGESFLRFVENNPFLTSRPSFLKNRSRPRKRSNQPKFGEYVHTSAEYIRENFHLNIVKFQRHIQQMRWKNGWVIRQFLSFHANDKTLIYFLLERQYQNAGQYRALFLS